MSSLGSTQDLLISRTIRVLGARQLGRLSTCPNTFCSYVGVQIAYRLTMFAQIFMHRPGCGRRSRKKKESRQASPLWSEPRLGALSSGKRRVIRCALSLPSVMILTCTTSQQAQRAAACQVNNKHPLGHGAVFCSNNAKQTDHGPGGHLSMTFMTFQNLPTPNSRYY